jgi:ABC-2 type transport system permease protein
MRRKQENYNELIWMLAKTDFKLRYQGSVLGYFWALLKPFLMFAVLNFVFSNVFARGGNIKYYPLQLLISLILFNFFAEGTRAGLISLQFKSALVTKIYVPRWTIILSSTINSAMIFVMNLVAVILFFAYYQYMPPPDVILMFVIFSILTYVLIVSFSFIASLLYIKFRDLLMIWDVLVSVLMYATPIIYSLQMLPKNVQQIILVNPMAFIIHFNKETLFNRHYPDPWQMLGFAFLVALFFALSVWFYRIKSPKIAEYM